MKDSAKLLNFNVNRDLKFKAFRGVNFDIGRDLAFNLNRNLSFNLDRDLGFGKRGVVFRGYVCPICGAPVAKDASNCDECHVEFEQTTPRKEKKVIKKEWDRGDRDYKKSSKTTPPQKGKSKMKSPPTNATQQRVSAQQQRVSGQQQRRSTFQCPVCGKLLYVGTSKCPDCDIVFDLSQRTSSRQLPAQHAPVPRSDMGPVLCGKCNYKIPPTDSFCRRCGSPKPTGTTVSWQEYKNKPQKESLVSWDEYSGRN